MICPSCHSGTLDHERSGTPGSVLSTAPIPPQDIARAAELARERGWKDVG